MANIKCIIPRGGNDDQKFKTLAEPSIKKIGCQFLQIFDQDKEKPENIFKKYNESIEALLNAGLEDDDIIIFMHSDVGIIDNMFKEKVEFLFSEKKDVAIVGIAGATAITERGGWWMTTPDKMRGHLIQGKDGGPGEGFHLQKGAIGYFDDVVCVDGCIMITQGKFLKEGLFFDDKTYDGNDFYDLDISMKVKDMGYSVAVADILIYHNSSGMGVFNNDWKKNREIFVKKWTDKGYKLPFTVDQFKKKDIESEIVEIDL
ncbi:MAG: glycosyltransferase [Atribacterota bacterium]